jgi:hypothetical protein
VELLLERGADVHAEDDEALRLAAKMGMKQVVELLLQHGADVHAEDDEALRLAARKGIYQVVELLLQHGADVHAARCKRCAWQPKTYASAGGTGAAAAWSRCACKDDDQALRLASQNGHQQVVQLLLEHGADVHAQHNWALTVAEQHGHEQVVQLLLQHGHGTPSAAANGTSADQQAGQPQDDRTGGDDAQEEADAQLLLALQRLDHEARTMVLKLRLPAAVLQRIGTWMESLQLPERAAEEEYSDMFLSLAFSFNIQQPFSDFLRSEAESGSRHVQDIVQGLLRLCTGGRQHSDRSTLSLEGLFGLEHLHFLTFAPQSHANEWAQRLAAQQAEVLEALVRIPWELLAQSTAAYCAQHVVQNAARRIGSSWGARGEDIDNR